MIRTMLVIAALMMASVAQAENRVYLGGNLGINSLQGTGNPDITGLRKDADKNGYLLGGKAFFSKMEESYILDAGFGYEFNKMSGDGVDMEIKTGYLDLAAKYRFDKTWSAGIQGEIHYGNYDQVNENNSGLMKSTSTLLGGQVAYDTEWGSVPVRYDASLLTNLNGDQRNLVAKVGISFALWTEKKKVAPMPRPKVMKEYIDREEVADVKVVLKFAKVSFGTDEYRIDDATKAKLARLGQYLAKNPDVCKRIKISGHTDERGGREYNLNLSKDRADSVLKIFTEAGVAETKMESFGYGFSRPIDTRSNAEAWEKNRRTEIEFFSVKDRKELNKILEQILK